MRAVSLLLLYEWKTNEGRSEGIRCWMRLVGKRNATCQLGDARVRVAPLSFRWKYMWDIINTFLYIAFVCY